MSGRNTQWMMPAWIAMLTVAVLTIRPVFAVELHAGDLVIVATYYDPATVGRVYRLDPTTLVPTPIGATALAQTPFSVAVDHSGGILIADGAHGLVAVDPRTATASVLADAAALGGNAAGVCVSPAGVVFVSVYGTTGAVVRVSSGGSIQPISTGGLLHTPFGLTLGPDGALYVAEEGLPADNGTSPFGFPSHGSIVRIDPGGGAQSLIATSSLFLGPYAILFNGSDEVWTAQEGSVAGREGCFIRTRLSTGLSDQVGTTSCRSHGLTRTADGTMVLSDCNTIGPDCYSPYTTRYPGGPTLNNLAGALALVPSDVVPVSRTTWGSLKTIYR
jgi:hypothetical protein